MLIYGFWSINALIAKYLKIQSKQIMKEWIVFVEHHDNFGAK